MVRSAFRRFQTYAGSNPVMVSFLVFLGVASIILPLSLIFWLTDAPAFLKNVVAEAHGTLFDLFIIGWFLMWLSRRAERAMTARRYREQIDDFLGWRSPTASHRIALNVRRLNRTGKRSNFRLTEAYVSNARLNEVKLVRSDLWGSDFSNASLEGAEMTASNLGGAIFTGGYLQRADMASVDARGASFGDADMKDAILDNADMRGADFTGTDFHRVRARGTDFRHARLERAIFRSADLSGADLRDADCRSAIFDHANLTGAELDGADLRTASLNTVHFENIDEAVSRLSTVHSLAGASLEPALRIALKKERPDLFEDQPEQDDTAA